MKSFIESHLTFTVEQTAKRLPPSSRTLRYVGAVSRVLNERVLKGMEKLMQESPKEEMGLFVTSPGGTTGAAMSFYDTVRHVLAPNLVTIGSGDVDSSGVLIFLSGTRRLLSKRTTLLLHRAGRVFGTQRYTTKEMAVMLEEDRLKDEQYASVLADNSRGLLSKEEALELMEKQTVLTPERALSLGLADDILS